MTKVAGTRRPRSGTKRILLAAIVLLGGGRAGHTQDFALHDGDTVVFYGDSITAQRLYTRDVEEAVLTRYPAMHVHFVNAGVPGDTVYGGYAGATAERVNRDVAAFKPNMITVMLGMNDAGYVPFSEKIDAVFRAGFVALLNALHLAAPEARLTIILPTPYDELTHGTEFPGYSSVVARNAETARALAAHFAVQLPGRVFVADCSHALTDALRRAKADAPEQAPWVVPDRIHPGEVGHWVMAAELLRVWHFTPMVSAITLAGTKALSQDKAVVTDVVRTPLGLSWTAKEASLPLPLTPGEPVTDLLLKVADVESLDREMLQVSDLPPGTYDLLVDGKHVAAFSGAELARGVNLALTRTPMLDEARGLEWWEQRRAYLEQARFILGAETKASNDVPAATRALERGEAELTESAKAVLKLTQHRFELKRREGFVPVSKSVCGSHVLYGEPTVDGFAQRTTKS